MADDILLQINVRRANNALGFVVDTPIIPDNPNEHLKYLAYVSLAAQKTIQESFKTSLKIADNVRSQKFADEDLR